MRKPLIIGDKSYKFKKDAIQHYREILNSYSFGQSLNEEDFNDLIDLLSLDLESTVSLEADLNKNKIKENFAFDKKHFSENQIDVFEKDTNRYIKCPTSTTKVINYENVEQLSRDVEIFKNERYYCLTDGNFIFGDFIEAFLVCRNMNAKELTISTLTLSEGNIDSLRGLIDGGFVDKLNLIVSDHFFSYERDNLIEYIYETLDIENKFQLSVCNIKSKVVLIQTEDNGGRKYVIHGSANLSSSNSIEQFCIEENEVLFDFNKNILNKIIENFKTINKSNNKAENKIVKEKLDLDNRPIFSDFAEREVDMIDIKVSQVQFNTRCFEIFYSDETSHFISYLKIINNTEYTPEKLFNVACRNSIHKDIQSVKKDYFDKNSVKGQVKCQETGLLSKWTELVVDHRQPNTFSIIIDRFKEVNKIDLNTIEYTSNEQNFIVFEDDKWTSDFKQYHKEKASLRIVRTECNSSRTGMARIKRTAKDLTIE
jgi:hypothetical protein